MTQTKQKFTTQILTNHQTNKGKQVQYGLSAHTGTRAGAPQCHRRRRGGRCG